MKQDFVFKYGNQESWKILKDVFEEASKRFLVKDKILLEYNVSERCLCGALKSRMEDVLNEKEVEGYYVDIEYNRNYKDVKKIPTIKKKKKETDNIVSDLILHGRNKDLKQDNLLTLEMKKTDQDDKAKELDRERLRFLTDENNSIDKTIKCEYPYRYIMGIFYEIDCANRKAYIEYYQNKRMVEKTKQEDKL